MMADRIKVEGKAAQGCMYHKIDACAVLACGDGDSNHSILDMKILKG
jgi:hypothetical protein